MAGYRLAVALLAVLSVPDDSRGEQFLLGTREGVKLITHSDASTSAVNLTGRESYNTLDYHLAKKLVFTHSDNDIYKFPLDINITAGSHQPTIFRTVGRCYDPCCPRLAVDWVQDRLYWVDCQSPHTTIMSADVDGNNDTTVFKRPRGHVFMTSMVLDPYQRKLFWRIQRHGTIESFDLSDGAFRKIYTTSDDVYWNAALALDLVEQRVYFVRNFNNTVGTLYSINYRGGDLRTHVSLREFGPTMTGLVVLKGHVYWMSSSNLYKAPVQSTGNSVQTIYNHPIIFSMKVIDPELQRPEKPTGNHTSPGKTGNPVIYKYGKSTITITTKELDNNTADGLTSHGEDNDERLLFLVASAEGITLVNLNSSTETNLHTEGPLWSVDYHLGKGHIYAGMHDSYPFIGLYRTFLEPNETIGKERFTALGEINDDFYGFAVDWVHNTIYWVNHTSEKTSSAIMALDLATMKNTVVKSGLDIVDSVHLAVDPYKRMIFWLAGITSYERNICSCSYAGDKYRTLYIKSTQKSSLHEDYDQFNNMMFTFTLDLVKQIILFISDSNKVGVLYSVDYNGENLYRHFGLRELDHPNSLTILNDHVYWNIKYTEHRTPYFEHGIIYKAPLNHSMNASPVLLWQGEMRRMRVVHPDLQLPLCQEGGSGKCVSSRRCWCSSSSAWMGDLTSPSGSDGRPIF